MCLQIDDELQPRANRTPCKGFGLRNTRGPLLSEHAHRTALRVRQDRHRRTRRRPASTRLAVVSSGGTAKAISAAGMPVTDLAELTGVPAILDHRVVTLHPKVHGGLLADPTKPSHQADMAEHGIEADRPRRVQPLPVRQRPEHRADRHRRAGDGARRGQEPRSRRRRRQPGRLLASCSTRFAPTARSAPRRDGVWPATRSPGSPRTTPQIATWFDDARRCPTTDCTCR